MSPPLVPYEPKPRPTRLTRLGVAEYVVIAIVFGVPGAALVLIGGLGLLLYFSRSIDLAADLPTSIGAIVIGAAFAGIAVAAVLQILRYRWRTAGDSGDTPETDANSGH